jgi:hypothetical protein
MTNKKNIKCLICKNILQKDLENIGIICSDYFCRKDDHFFAQRIVNNNITKIKIRVLDSDGTRLFMRINYDLNNVQVWRKSELNGRVTIDSIPPIEFIDYNNLISKIKTYLTFS